MQQRPDNSSYSPENLVVVAVASCFSSIAIVGAFYWAVDSELMLPFLITSVWCVIVNFAVAVSLIPLSKMLKKLTPSWLVVPVIGTFLSVFSFLLYGHWNAVSRYVPGDPFSSPPGPVSDVIWFSFKLSLFLSFLAIAASFLALEALKLREGSTELDLN